MYNHYQLTDGKEDFADVEFFTRWEVVKANESVRKDGLHYRLVEWHPSDADYFLAIHYDKN